MLFLTQEMVRIRRKAGLAIAGGLVAYWLTGFPLGPAGLLLLLAAFTGLGLGLRWLAIGQRTVRSKAASVAFVLAFIAQVRASVLAVRLALNPDGGYTSDALMFLIATHAVPALLLLAAGLAGTDAVRRRESALLWISFGLAVVLSVVGMGNGAAMYSGNSDPEFYRAVVLVIRAIMLLPALVAAVFLAVPPRQVMTDEEVTRAAEQAAAAATVAAQNATDSAQQLVNTLQVQAAASRPDMIALLDERLARGEISEATYLALSKKYG